MTVIERTPVKAATARPEYQVTEWGLPHELILTYVEKDHRPIRYDRYLQSEIERWEATNGREAWVLENSKQEVLPHYARSMEPVSPLWFNRPAFMATANARAGGYLHWRIYRRPRVLAQGTYQDTSLLRSLDADEVVQDGDIWFEHYVAERGEAIALFSWREYQKPVED